MRRPFLIWRRRRSPTLFRSFPVMIEARLIFLWVSSTLRRKMAVSYGRKLMSDIVGGFIELVIGENSSRYWRKAATWTASASAACFAWR
ncbi:MAG: hypothetical protein GPOALKHO_000167 [Sodalis sp.]|nr:MAG: hypothetical protein GPOALKHO_000167 [Sodalis sp.]